MEMRLFQHHGRTPFAYSETRLPRLPPESANSGKIENRHCRTCLSAFGRSCVVKKGEGEEENRPSEAPKKEKDRHPRLTDSRSRKEQHANIGREKRPGKEPRVVPWTERQNYIRMPRIKNSGPKLCHSSKLIS
ncbi:unnamed protein product [Bursaphelenchus xylophilus]|uniref:(pine wood nematode) hypothetical protein n=1 Tax=Bursaphelenchus xylophilus TaxID=6326 RepID=A0A1I7ST18_BURXY|nr:unnamed protein product [Bursaphelenchus xylophilus]CAG9108793.1 unnamed protein product [Bursaphelenchus xylophilus]